MSHHHSGSSSSGKSKPASSGSSLMSMSGMEMTFFTSTSTPLFSSRWTPRSTGSYAGTCIFLIILALLFRFLLAAKMILEHRWKDQRLARRYVIVRGKPTEAERIAADDQEGKDMVLVTARGVEESVRVVKAKGRAVAPWRFSQDLPRAALGTVLAGVGYLLMIAVMTMNVGYFLAVLGGTFLGELAVGRYGQMDEH